MCSVFLYHCYGTDITGLWSGNTWPQSSQLAEPLWIDPGLKEWNWFAGGGGVGGAPKNPSMREEAIGQTT